jgi:two-component system sensor histidine kinase UhpB
MLYAAAGLVSMFGAVAILGLGAIDEATQLVYRERLTTAYTTAGILERDFVRVGAEVRAVAAELFPGSSARVPAGAAAGLLYGFERQPQSYPFFSISGVWLLDGRGRLLDQAGEPRASSDATASAGARFATAPTGDFGIFRAVGPVNGASSFAALAVRIAGLPGAPGPVVVVHTVSLNRTEPYVPATHGQPVAVTPDQSMADATAEEYHLEVVSPDGITVLGIGPDEHPGQRSPHFAAIESLMASGTAATLLHEPRSGEGFEPHVMAAVPLSSSPFYVVIEQPVDVALALPIQLRNRLLLSIGLGFMGTLVVAWVTTRRVVKPTERLTRAAERMAGGDLTIPIEVVAQDEVGQLAESLETMRQRLRAAYEAVEQTNRELESRVADRTARLGQVVRKTILAQEEERLRLARELHDETAQALAALTIALDRARDDLDGPSTDARERIREARAIAGRLLSETRRLILGLRPSVLDDLGLAPAIRWLCETGLADRGVEVSIDADQGGARLPGHVEVALFRIIQEAVGNIARHAGATHVRIGMSVAAEVARVTVADDGRGFDVARAMGPDGSDSSVGLVGMQERVAILGGSIEIRSAPGSGTEIVVEVPVVPEAA